MIPTGTATVARTWLACGVLALGACTDPVLQSATGPFCPVVPLAPGTVDAGWIVCSDQRFTTNGEGRAQDLWLANSSFRAVFRHPTASLGAPGIGGGSLIDIAPWGRADVLHEALPLIDGAGLDVTALEVVGPDEADRRGLRLTGRRKALPGQPALPADAQTEHQVTWWARPDSPWLELEGATALRVHPRVAMHNLDGWLFGEDLVIGHDASIVEDTGGAVLLQDVRRLLVSTRAVAMAQRDPDTRPIVVDLEGADELQLFAGGTQIGVLNVSNDGVVDAFVPARVDQVVATGPGKIPADLSPDTSSATLADATALRVETAWGPSVPRPVALSWSPVDVVGPLPPTVLSGTTVLPPTGISLALPPGTYDLTASAGLSRPEVTTRVVVPVLGTAPTATLPLQGFETGSWIASAPRWPMGRDLSQRASDADRLRAAMLAGYTHVIGTAAHNVPSLSLYRADQPWIRGNTGLVLTDPAGWAVSAWPWSESIRAGGHGAPDVRSQAPNLVAQSVQGGEATDRRLTVDLAWLSEQDVLVPFTEPRPEEVFLTAPGPAPFDAWKPWFDALDRGMQLTPTGPVQWLNVDDGYRYGDFEIERAIERARSVAGTGPLLRLRAQRQGAGSTLDEAPKGTLFTVTTVGALPGQLDHVVLVGTGGVVLAGLNPSQIDLDQVVPLDSPRGWLTAIGWSDDGSEWAVVSPLWMGPPDGQPPDTATP